MGKGTSHWTNVQQEEAAILARYKALYEKNKGLRFTSDGPFKIPKVVHFIWLGPRSFPPGSVDNVRTWMAKNPEWEFKFWTDRDRDPPCKGMETFIITKFPFPHLASCYEQSENWGEKSDILRFEILYHEGGVYVDHDANCLQPFDGLHRGYDFYCCLEVPHPPVAGHQITAGIGVLGSRSHHPAIKQVIDLIQSRWNELAQKYPGKDGFSKTQIVMERTYLPLTNVLKDKINQDGNVDIVLPAAYFFAKPGLPPLYSKHFFGNSWASEENKSTLFEHQMRRELSKVDHKISNIFFFSAPLLCFNLILIAIALRLTKKRKS